MRKTLIYLLLISAYTALHGCGTTGPLYIPEQRYPQDVKSEPAEEMDSKQPKQTPNK